MWFMLPEMLFLTCSSWVEWSSNSIKSTPCRGVGHVLCATLARVRRPAAGRLVSCVRLQEEFHACRHWRRIPDWQE